MEEKSEWFEKWFDSLYYHILYKNRGNEEAEGFIRRLIQKLAPPKNSLLLDAACGKGRHAIYLNKLGFKVDGFDLSQNSIKIAKIFETKTLNFYINDIRSPLNTNCYDIVFNLFTSFGYFENNKDNQLAINAISESLKANGMLILDFMNSNKTIDELSEIEIKMVNHIEFYIKKSFKEGFIIKDINFTDQNKKYYFQEKVRAISLEDFKIYFDNANLKIENIFGDYSLNPYNMISSDRLILLARKQ